MGKSRKVPLAKALKNNQARNTAHQRAEEARRQAVKQGKHAALGTGATRLRQDPKGKRKEGKLPSSDVPFQADDRILLVGEGNFSFTLALAVHHSIPASHILATTLDSEAECYRKYPDDAEHVVKQLRDKGVKIAFGVDATRLQKNKEIYRAKGGWNKVVFNFPHVGAGITDQDRNILTNQFLLLGFLRSVAPLLSKGTAPAILLPRKPQVPQSDSDDSDAEDDVDTAPAAPIAEDEEDEEDEEFLGIPDSDDEDEQPFQNAPAPRLGVVLITLRDTLPYTLWDLPKLAKRPPPNTKYPSESQPRYLQVRSSRFWPEAYPGYEHRRTRGKGAVEQEREEGMGGTGGVCRTWEFVLWRKDLDRSKRPETKGKK